MDIYIYIYIWIHMDGFTATNQTIQCTIIKDDSYARVSKSWFRTFELSSRLHPDQLMRTHMHHLGNPWGPIWPHMDPYACMCMYMHPHGHIHVGFSMCIVPRWALRLGSAGKRDLLLDAACIHVWMDACMRACMDAWTHAYCMHPFNISYSGGAYLLCVWVRTS